MDIATLLYIGGALTGTVVGDAFDPLSLNDKDANKVIVQEMCDTTTTTDFNGLVSKVETCRTMKTTQHNQ